LLLASIGLRSGEFVYITKAAPEWQPGMTFDQICDMLWSGIPEDDIEAQEEQVRLQEAYAIKLAGWEERHRMLPSGGHARGAVHQASDAAAGTAAGAAPAASASRRGVLEVSQDTVSGTGFKTYLGHVWSEEDWYEDYTTKPPRDNLGSWEVDKGVFATGYLLDRKFFPPKAGCPRLSASSTMVSRATRWWHALMRRTFQARQNRRFRGWLSSDHGLRLTWASLRSRVRRRPPHLELFQSICRIKFSPSFRFAKIPIRTVRPMTT